MDGSRNFLLELISGVVTPDYLLEDTRDTLEAILTLKDKKHRQQLFEGHTQRLEKVKTFLRTEHIDTPFEKIDSFLKDFYAYIDGLDNWLIDGFEKQRANWKKYRELKNERDGLFGRWCVLYRTKANHAREKEKQTAGEKKEPPKPKESKRAKAFAYLMEHTDKSDTAIAEAVGVSRTTLYNYPEYKALRKVFKLNKGNILQGSKSPEGKIEAIDE